MVTRTDCPCGKTDLSSAQMTMHNRSKAHQDWEATLSDAGIAVEAIAEGEDRELEGVLAAARNGGDVRHIAKMTRSIFAARDWPKFSPDDDAQTLEGPPGLGGYLERCRYHCRGCD